MQQQDTTTLVYDLGQHTLERTNEGGILITEQGGSTALFKEAVQLDQDETYKLLLVSEMWFTMDEGRGNHRQNGLGSKGGERCW